MSDGGRERASLGLGVWKSSQKWSVLRSAVRSIAWLGLSRGKHSLVSSDARQYLLNLLFGNSKVLHHLCPKLAQKLLGKLGAVGALDPFDECASSAIWQP